MRYFKQHREQGFTLVELLIAMALALVIVAALSSTFIMQRKTYNTQEQVAEMTQNGRAVMDIMTREIRMTGYGTPEGPAANISPWVDWVSGVTFNAGPIVIEDGAGASGSDIIHIAACFDGPAGSLSVAASEGDTSITLQSGEGVKFNTTNKKLINIGNLENTVVTGISGNVLTIDTDPNTSGNQGLKKDHVINEEVSIVKVISYSIVQESDGMNVLKRNENVGGGDHPVAENIVDLQISLTNKTININPLTAQTDKPDPDFSQNGGHRTFDQRTFITPPNLLTN